MNLDYLKSFFVIVESNSISKAARKLHLTQPGLSMQLQNLENEIGAKLLIRSNKGVKLTKEGKMVYEQAKNILTIEQNIRQNIKEIQSEKDILNVASCKSFGQYVLPNLIFRFRESHPDLQVNLNINSTCNIIKSFMSHETNIGIITDAHNYDDITSYPLMEDKLALLSSVHGKDELTLDELREVPLIIRDDSSCTRLLLSDFIKPYGLDLNDLNIILSSNSLETIKSTIISGHGYSFLPKLFAIDELKMGTLKEVKVPIDTSFSYHFASREDKYLSSYEQEFKEFILSDELKFNI